MPCSVPNEASRSPTRRRRCRAVGAALTFALLSIAVASPAAWAAGQLGPGTGAPAPPLVLRDLDGHEVRLESFRGRAVVVNFWATWCAPCVAEMPSLSRLRERLAGSGVEVIAVNLRENAARIRPFAEKLALDFTIVRDHDGSVTSTWGARIFPTTFIVGPDQRIALVATGEIDWDAPDVEARVRAVAVLPGTAPPVGRAQTFLTPFAWSPPWIVAAF